jgi:hypothetical protein
MPRYQASLNVNGTNNVTKTLHIKDCNNSTSIQFKVTIQLQFWQVSIKSQGDANRGIKLDLHDD